MIRFLQTEGKTKKYVLGGLLLIVCGSMVVFLTQGINSTGATLGSDQGVIATVAGDKITSQEVVEEGRAMLREQSAQGRQIPEMMLPYFNKEAMEKLINQKALLVAAQDMGLRVNDDEVREELEHGRYHQTFFPDGKFIGNDRYKALLQENSLTVEKFENVEKKALLLQKLQAMIVGAAAVSNAQVDAEVIKRNTKVKFDYAVVDLAEVKKGIHPGDAELKAFYEQNKANYANSIPEKRKLVYAVVDTTKVQSQVSVSNDQLKTYYQQHANQYQVPEQVLLRHILIKLPLPGTDGKTDQKALDAAQSKANDVLKQLKAGGDFGKLAKQYSEDPGSNNTDGLVGWIQRGHYGTADLEKSVFALAKGQTSDVLKSGYAFHIVRMEDKQDAHLKPLEEVKNDIEPILKAEAAQRQAAAQANTLLQDAKAKGIEGAARGTAVSTDFVSISDSLPGIGSAQELMAAAFAAKEKAAPTIARTPQGYAVFVVLAIQPPATPTFEQIRGKVEEQFKNERSGVLMGKKSQELFDRAKTSHDLKKAAKELGLTVKTSEPVLATGQVPDIGSMGNEGLATVFSGKPGDVVGPVQVGQNGAVVQVVSHEEPSAEEMAKAKDQVRDFLLQSKRQEMFGLYVTNLRQQMEKSGKIVINEAEKKQITAGFGAPGL